eukprot:6988262-Pyramimonas_sp.AAC.1
MLNGEEGPAQEIILQDFLGSEEEESEELERGPEQRSRGGGSEERKDTGLGNFEDDFEDRGQWVDLEDLRRRFDAL